MAADFDAFVAKDLTALEQGIISEVKSKTDRERGGADDFFFRGRIKILKLTQIIKSRPQSFLPFLPLFFFFFSDVHRCVFFKLIIIISDDGNRRAGMTVGMRASGYSLSLNLKALATKVRSPSIVASIARVRVLEESLNI